MSYNPDYEYDPIHDYNHGYVHIEKYVQSGWSQRRTDDEEYQVWGWDKNTARKIAYPTAFLIY